MTTEAPAAVEGPCSSGGGQVSSTTPPICYVCFTSILLKKSEIKQLRKSRVRANSVVSTGSSHSKA